MRPNASQLNAGFVKFQSGEPRVELLVASIANVAEEIGTPTSVREEFSVNCFVVKAGHRADVQPQSAFAARLRTNVNRPGFVFALVGPHFASS